MRVCPACKESWPEDRFNGVHDECFKCRIQGLSVSFGNVGRKVFHETTVKEFNDRQVREAKRNGMDIVPAHTSSVSVAGSAIRKLESGGV